MDQITSAEWRILDCLWEATSMTGHEAVEHLKLSAGWSRSTTLTMLRRMTNKGLVSCSKVNGVNVYTPLVCRQKAVQSQTKSFLDRVYHGSISMLLATFTHEESLSQQQIDELYAILKEVEPHA